MGGGAESPSTSTRAAELRGLSRAAGRTTWTCAVEVRRQGQRLRLGAKPAGKNPHRTWGEAFAARRLRGQYELNPRRSSPVTWGRRVQHQHLSRARQCSGATSDGRQPLHRVRQPSSTCSASRRKREGGDPVAVKPPGTPRRARKGVGGCWVGDPHKNFDFSRHYQKRGRDGALRDCPLSPNCCKCAREIRGAHEMMKPLKKDTYKESDSTPWLQSTRARRGGGGVGISKVGE